MVLPARMSMTKKNAMPTLQNFVVLGVVGSLYCYIPSLSSILLRSSLPLFSLLSVPTTLAGILRARSYFCLARYTRFVHVCS